MCTSCESRARELRGQAAKLRDYARQTSSDHHAGMLIRSAGELEQHAARMEATAGAGGCWLATTEGPADEHGRAAAAGA